MKNTVIPYQYSVLCDKDENTEKSHVIQNFVNAANAINDKDVGDGFFSMVFQDSDAAKWLEAAAYTIEHCLDFAKHFISARGVDNIFFNLI